MKHYEQQEMVKSKILHKLQVTCNEEWNVMNSKKWSNAEYYIHQENICEKHKKDVLIST